MILYLDSSALVKLFIAEQGSPSVHAWVARADSVATSRIAYAEACAAFARRYAERRLSRKEFAAARAALSAQWPTFAAVEIDEFKAGELAITHNLRGFDAVHLVAALEIRKAVSAVPLLFCSYDQRQMVAARAEGLPIAEGTANNSAS